MKTLVTTNGCSVLLDDEDYERVAGMRWFYEDDPDHARVYTTVRVSLHRVIMDAPPTMDVHHVDQNPLNNQRHNLEVVSKTDHGRRHMINAGPREGMGAGQYKGICYLPSKDRWRASIKVDGRNVVLGSHRTAEDAALVYDAAVLHYRGGEGYLNLLPEACIERPLSQG